jgi:hypothetical protein
MIIPFPYEIINRYYKGWIYKNDVIKSIKLAFDNAINKEIKDYKIIHNNRSYCFSSKIVAYDYFLFGPYNYIEYWINSNEDNEYFNYNINNAIKERCEYSQLDYLYYIDLMLIFDNFLNQKNKYFELHEINYK